MGFTDVLTLLLIGVIAGTVGGMFGVGGGIIVVPGLVFFLGLSQYAAQGTSIGMMILPIGILAAWNYYESGNLNVKYALILAFAFVLGGYIGSKISLGISESTLKRMFGGLMLLASLKLIFFPK